MSIIRTEKSVNYTTICNKCLRDESISARAKGIFAYLMTLPDDWKVYKSELHKHFSEGRDALNTAFAELEMAGYVKKAPARNADGTVSGWDYTIYESTDLLENRNTVNPSDGESASTKYLLEQSTKDTNVADAPAVPEAKASDKSHTAERKQQKLKGTPPTVEQVVAYAKEHAVKHGRNTKPYVDKAIEAHEFYTGNMKALNAKVWKDGNGNTVKSWKLKLMNNWFKNVQDQQQQQRPKPIIIN